MGLTDGQNCQKKWTKEREKNGGRKKDLIVKKYGLGGFMFVEERLS